MKVLRIKYRTPTGNVLEGNFLKTFKGYKAVHIYDEYLDEANEIIEIRELEYSDIKN